MVIVHLRRGEASMLGWFHALMPREERFFDMFEEHAGIVLAGAEALQALVQSPPEEIAVHCRTVMDRETDADRVTRDVMIAVRRTFITPFDRRDIQHLITAMDDAVDQMQKTAKAITLFDVTTFEPEMREVAGAAVACAKLVNEAIPLMRRLEQGAPRIAAIAEEIAAIEGKADDLHDRGLKALFRRHAAPNEMSFIVGSTIFEHLEGVVDRFDDIANEINAIVVEHL